VQLSPCGTIDQLFTALHHKSLQGGTRAVSPKVRGMDHRNEHHPQKEEQGRLLAYHLEAFVSASSGNPLSWLSPRKEGLKVSDF